MNKEMQKPVLDLITQMISENDVVVRMDRSIVRTVEPGATFVKYEPGTTRRVLIETPGTGTFNEETLEPQSALLPMIHRELSVLREDREREGPKEYLRGKIVALEWVEALLTR